MNALAQVYMVNNSLLREDEAVMYHAYVVLITIMKHCEHEQYRIVHRELAKIACRVLVHRQLE